MLASDAFVPFISFSSSVTWQSLCFVLETSACMKKKLLHRSKTLVAPPNESSESSDWGASDESDKSDNELAVSPNLRTNLRKILRESVQPVASGRSSQDANPRTLEKLTDKTSLFLTSLEFENEEKEANEMGVQSAQVAFQKGDPSSDDRTKNFWFKFSNTHLKAAHDEVHRNFKVVCSQFPEWLQDEIKEVDGAGKNAQTLKYVRPPDEKTNENEPSEVTFYRRNLAEYCRTIRLKPILKTIETILLGNSEMILTCGIGVIRKRTVKGSNINYPVLEIDLCCRHTEFRPDCHLHSNTPEIRLCPLLSGLEASSNLEDHTLQAKAQVLLDRYIKRQESLPTSMIRFFVCNPFFPRKLQQS